MRRGPPSTRSTVGVVLSFVGSFFGSCSTVGVDVERAARAQESATEGGDPGSDVLVRGGRESGFVSRARVEDAPREITDAASLIEPLPGVHVRRLGADDSFATLSIRGSTSAQVAVYLAGVPLSGGGDPSLDLATLPLWPGAQARVHRTFAPASLGRGSLGGTLVIDPPSPRSPARTEVWTAVGAYGARRLRVGDVRGDPERARVATGLSASRSDDDFRYLDPIATGEAARDVLATRQNAGHAAAAGLASVAIPVHLGASSAGALTMTGLAQARRQELPGAARSLTPYQRLESTRLVSALELTVPAGSGALGVRGWGRREGLALHDDPQSARATLGPASTDDAIVAAGASTGWRGRPTEETALELRIDGSAERFAPGTWSLGAAPPGARRTSAGVALDASARVLSSVALAASARADTWSDGSDDGESSAEARPTGNVGVELPVGPVLVAAHGGLVARPPSFVERYGNRGAFVDNPALVSESALTADAGGRLTRRLGPVRLHAETAAFATWADDLITLVYAGARGKLRAQNVGRARLLGLEGELRGEAFGFDIRVSYTGLVTANEGACVYESSRCARRPSLPGRPAHDLVGDLTWTRGPVRLRYGVDLTAGIYADLEENLEVPPRVFHGAGIRVAIPWAPGLSVALDVRNLLDLRAVDYVGATGPVRLPVGDLYDYPLPGRRVLVTARWTTETR